MSGEDSIIDIEFLIPVNKEFESNEFYVYKPKLRILNAARLRHTDSLISLSASKKALQHYIIDNDLSAVTDFYFQIIKLDFDTVVDIYVGLNENIV